MIIGLTQFWYHLCYFAIKGIKSMCWNENTLIFATLATIRKAGVHSDLSFADIFTTDSLFFFFLPSCPYRQPEREKRSAAFQTKEPLTARTLSALPAFSSHQHDERPRTSFNRLHAQGAWLFKSMSHFSLTVCFLRRNDSRTAFLLTSRFAKINLNPKFGWGWKFVQPAMSFHGRWMMRGKGGAVEIRVSNYSLWGSQAQSSLQYIPWVSESKNVWINRTFFLQKAVPKHCQLQYDRLIYQTQEQYSYVQYLNPGSEG